jgi:hypothetical protein
MIKLRYLFFLLILINVIFFLWSLRTGMVVKAEIPLVTMNSGEKQIFLASEVKTPESKKKKKIKKRIKQKRKIIKPIEPLINTETVIEQPIAPIEFVIDPSSIQMVTDQQQDQPAAVSTPGATSKLVIPAKKSAVVLKQPVAPAESVIDLSNTKSVTDSEQNQSVAEPPSDSVNEIVKPSKKSVQVIKKPVSSAEQVIDSTTSPQVIIDSERNQSVLP